jgi:hypothetical protein
MLIHPQKSNSASPRLRQLARYRQILSATAQGIWASLANYLLTNLGIQVAANMLSLSFHVTLDLYCNDWTIEKLLDLSELLILK